MDEKIDWAAAETAYVSGNMSMEKLAEQLGCSPTTVKKHAAREGWCEKKKDYARKVAKKATSKTATKASSVLSKAWGTARKFVEIMDREADRIQAMQAMSYGILDRGQRLLDEGDAVGADELKSAAEELMRISVNAKDISLMSSALDKLTDTIRKAADLPTKAERAAMKNAAERLALQKKLAEDDAAGGKSIVIRMEGDTSGFAD